MMLMEKPIVVIDTETTGLDPAKHEVIEFAGIKIDPVTLEVIDTLTFKVKPLHIETAQSKALEVNGYTPEAWAEAIDPLDAAQKIAKFCAYTVIVGHNVRFDFGFIHALFDSQGVKARIDYHVVDTVSLAYTKLAKQGLASLTLANVCKFLDIDPEDSVHRAMAGAEKCYEVYKKLA